MTARSASHRAQHLSTDEPGSGPNHQPVRKEGQSRPAIRRLDTSLGRQAYPFLGLFELERYDREDKTWLGEGAKAARSQTSATSPLRSLQGCIAAPATSKFGGSSRSLRKPPAMN